MRANYEKETAKAVTKFREFETEVRSKYPEFTVLEEQQTAAFSMLAGRVAKLKVNENLYELLNPVERQEIFALESFAAFQLLASDDGQPNEIKSGLFCDRERESLRKAHANGSEKVWAFVRTSSGRHTIWATYSLTRKASRRRSVISTVPRRPRTGKGRQIRTWPVTCITMQLAPTRSFRATRSMIGRKTICSHWALTAHG